LYSIKRIVNLITNRGYIEFDPGCRGLLKSTIAILYYVENGHNISEI
jgi:hypothetical protein